MFKKNDSYQQPELFNFESALTSKQKKYFSKSTESLFFEEVFHKIDEKKFACLYAENNSRPNVPVNQLVGALVLKHLHNWTYSMLFNNLTFNALTRYAIGITDPSQDIFSEASIFNFQNRVISHFNETGEDLISQVFLSITDEHLKKYKVNTSVQRGDSFLVDSNVMDYTKLRILIEVLLRLHRVVDEKDSEQLADLLATYSKKTSIQYVFEIRKQAILPEYEQIAQIYYAINLFLNADKYKEMEPYINFIRVYNEYFFEEKGDDGNSQFSIKPDKQTNSSNLLTPDDPDATFSSKYGKSHVGFSTHISETRHEENNLELITDVVVDKNNVGDCNILEARIEEMKKRMPDWDEYFVDSAYGSEKVDRLNKKNNITLYQTNIKGRKSSSGFRIHQDDEKLTVSCGGGQIINPEKTEAGYKATFDPSICSKCPQVNKCKIKEKGGKRVAKNRTQYFNEANILAHERFQNLNKIPKHRRSIRANVEATVKEMKRGMKNGKVRVRKLIRVSMHMMFTALSINLRRIHLQKV